MLTREQLNDRLVDYLYDEMTADDRQAFEYAVEKFPDLHDEVLAHQRTRKAMAQFPLEEPPAAALHAIMRAARHEVAPPAPQPSLLDKLLAMLTQPAFATAAIVAGIGLTAFFTMDGLRQADDRSRSTLNQPVVAVADSPERSANETKKAATEDLKEPADEVALAGESAPAVAIGGAKADDTSVAPSTPPPSPPAADPLVATAATAATAERAEAGVQSVLRKKRGARRVVQSKKSRKRKRATRKSVSDESAGSAAITEAKSEATYKNLSKDMESAVAPRRSPSPPSKKIAEGGRSQRAAGMERTRASAGATVTTHPGMGNTRTTSPANAEKRLRDRFNTLVKAGKVAEAKRVLAELEKLPSVSKTRLQALRKALAKAQRADAPAETTTKARKSKAAKAEPAPAKQAPSKPADAN